MTTSPDLLPDSAEFARMERALFDRLERGHRRKVVTHRLAAAGVVVLLSGGTVAGATIANETGQTNVAYCYPTSDGSPNGSVSRVSVSTADTRGATTGRSATKQTQASRVTNAVARCGALWRGGLLSTDGTALKRSPRLQACITNSQVIAVYPNAKAVKADRFCGDLGLSTP